MIIKITSFKPCNRQRVRKFYFAVFVMEYFIRQRNYDIMAINDVLYDLNLKLLSVHTEVKNKDSNPETKRSGHAKQD